VGAGSDEINQYSLDVPFDISNPSSITFDGTFSIAAQESIPHDVVFSNDGLTLFVTGSNGDEINQYSLGRAYDITSVVTFDGAQSVVSEDNAPTALSFNADGTRLFSIGVTNDNISEYSLTNGAFDVTGGITLENSVNVRPESNDARSLSFSPDGLQLNIVNLISSEVNVYSLSTPFDINTLTLVDEIDVSAQDGTPRDIVFSNDGRRAFLLGSENGEIYQYNIEDIDADSDGVFDRLDLDSDNDGISDLAEASQGAS